MSWPQHFYKTRQDDQRTEGDHCKSKSLSAKAMQLSIFGSMVGSVVVIDSLQEPLRKPMNWLQMFYSLSADHFRGLEKDCLFMLMPPSLHFPVVIFNSHIKSFASLALGSSTYCCLFD